MIAYSIIFFVRPGLTFGFLREIRFELIVGVFLLAIIFFSKEKLGLINIKRDPISSRLFVFLAVVVISMLFAVDFQTAYNRTIEFLKIYAFFLFIIAFIKDERDLKIFLWTFAALLAWAAYEPLYNYIYKTEALISRADTVYAVAETGRGSGHVALGIYLCQGLSFSWYLTAYGRNHKAKIAGTILVALCLAGIFVSGSRGAFVGLLLFFILITYFSKQRLKMALAGTILLVAALFFMGTGYRAWVSTISELGDSDASASSRIAGLRHGLEMLVKRPMFGVGPGCYPVARKMWFGWGLWSHNVYGQLAGDLGIAGIISWSIFVYSYMKRALYISRSFTDKSVYFLVSRVVIVANIVCLALGFFAHMLYGYIWYISAGLVIVCFRLIKSNHSSTNPVTGLNKSHLPSVGTPLDAG